MNRDEAKDEIKRRIPCTDFLDRSKDGLYNCPYCGSGTGKRGTGALKVYRETNTWCCHKCRKIGESIFTGDVIDLYMKTQGVDYITAINDLAARIGIAIDDTRHGQTQRSGTMDKKKSDSPHKDTADKAARKKTKNSDYSLYYQKCVDNLKKDEAAQRYLIDRGISLETAVRVRVGFDPEADPANAPGATEWWEERKYPTPRIILPSSKSFYTGRRIDGKEEYRYSNAEDETPTVFNGEVFYYSDRVFLTEGAFDALSLLEVGYPAAATNSTTHADKVEPLIREMQREGKEIPVILLCFDNDSAGIERAESLKKTLETMGVVCADVTKEVCGQHDDPNEALTADREQFKQQAARAYSFIGKEEAQAQTSTQTETKEGQQMQKPNNTSLYIDTLMSKEIAEYKADIKTGFALFDKNTGGLHPGLYTLTASPGVGKTTFILQIADQLAANGHDVMFFTLEQSRLEIVSKSIARFAFIIDKETDITSLDIRNGNNSQRVTEAIQKYKQVVGDRVSVYDGDFSYKVQSIIDEVDGYIQNTNTRPVVFIDYLQILLPDLAQSGENKRGNVEDAVKSLRKLAKEKRIVVFVISSVSRTFYTQETAIESAKEGGGVEYTADCSLGLQYERVYGKVKDDNGKLVTFDSLTVEARRRIIDEEKGKPTRKLRLSCVKNRYGVGKFDIVFEYNPSHDYFQEEAIGGSTTAGQNAAIRYTRLQ